MNELITLEPLHRHNWEKYTNLSVGPDAEGFLQSNLFVIARSSFEGLRLFGIVKGMEEIGLIATYYKDTLLWISHIMVEARYQQMGYGSKALTLLQSNPSIGRVSEFRTGVLEGNRRGLDFFMANGFTVMHQMSDGEIILHKRGRN